MQIMDGDERAVLNALHVRSSMRHHWGAQNVVRMQVDSEGQQTVFVFMLEHAEAVDPLSLK